MNGSALLIYFSVNLSLVYRKDTDFKNHFIQINSQNKCHTASLKNSNSPYPRLCTAQ